MKRIVFIITFILLFISGISFAKDATKNSPLINPFSDSKTHPCIDCHRLPNINTNEGIKAERAFCMECHGKKECLKDIKGKKLSLFVDVKSFKDNPHRFVACIQCHKDVAKLPHKTERGAVCTDCHYVHGEGKIHDPHLEVSCQACHHISKRVVFSHSKNMVVLAHLNDKKSPISLTDHHLSNTEEKNFCYRCHYKGNEVNAPSHVLPSKGFICMLCHSAPFKGGSIIFIVAFLAFLIGLISMVSFWLKGSIKGLAPEVSSHQKVDFLSELVWKKIFSKEIFSIIRVFFLDILLQRRILKESIKRWSLHSLIYLSIILRFSMGLFTTVIFALSPGSSLSMALINKNHPFTSFFYDLLGVTILIGIIISLLQRLIIRPKHVTAEIQDTIALYIIGLLVIAGFILEGARIAMMGVPQNIGGYSFIAYPISLIFKGTRINLSSIYHYFWYTHAVLGALLIAYIPFGKMRHIFVTPLSLFLNYKSD